MYLFQSMVVMHIYSLVFLLFVRVLPSLYILYEPAPSTESHDIKIVFISSVVGLSGNQGQANYAASKAGLIGLAKSISKEMGSRNITSNVVAPGYIETDMTSFLDDQNKENIIEQLSIKRIGKPEDISNIVSFLCKDESEYITGQVIPVDGGLTT